MILCKQDLEDAVCDFEDGILDPDWDGDDFNHDDDYVGNAYDDEDFFPELGRTL